MEKALPGIWRFGAVEFDETSGEACVAGDRVALDRSCRAILSALLLRAGEPVSKDELLAVAWRGRTVHENSLVKAIGRLRQQLGPDGKAIESVHGHGYRFALEATWTADSPPPGGMQAANEASGARRDAAARRHFPWRRLFVLPVPPAIFLALEVLLLALGVGVCAQLYLLNRNERAEGVYRQQAEALLDFVSRDVVAAADPYASWDDEASLRSSVEHVASGLDTRFADQPAARVALHRAVAAAFSGWGEYEKAVAHLDRAYILAAGIHGARAPESISIDVALCQQLRLAGDTRRAERICLRAETEAEAGKSPELDAARLAHAKLFFEIGDYQASAARLAAILEGGTDNAAFDLVADAWWFYGLAAAKLARFVDADGAFRKHIEMREMLEGDDHPLTAWAYADYGDYLSEVGRFEEAESFLARAERIFNARLGADHPESLSPGYSRAVIDLWRGESAPARDALRRILSRYRATLGSDHFWTLYTMTELALAEAQTGGRAAAEALLREARETGARILYGREAKAAHFHMRWARALLELGNFEEAEDEIRRARIDVSAQYAPGHPWRARVHCLAWRLALARGDASLARRESDECTAGLAAVADLPPTYPTLVDAQALRLAGPMSQAQAGAQ